MTLDSAKPGEKIVILSIANSDVRSQAIRLGISEGSVILCEHKLPAGPIVIQYRLQEVAIGRKLAQQITIAKVG